MARHYLNSVARCDCMGCKSADKHREEMVDKLQDKEKKVDEIATADEIKQKKIEEIKKSIRSMSAEELDEELVKLREELDNMKEEKQDDKQSKQASLELIGVDNSRSTRSESNLERVGYDSNYSVLTYKAPSTESQKGDELLILMGSTK